MAMVGDAAGAARESAPAVVKHCFGCAPGDIAQKVLIVRKDRLEEYLSLMSEAREFSGVWKGATGTHKGKSVSVIVTGAGASNVGDCIIALSGTPCKKILVEGTFGGISDDINIGDFAVVESATIGEGFSPYYSQGNKRGISEGKALSAGSIALISDYAKSMGSKVHRGCKFFTTSSFMAESEAFITGLKAYGHHGIEMEASAAFTAAKHIGVDASFVAWCTDLPIGKGFFDEKRTSDEKIKSNINALWPEMLLGAVVLG